MESIESNRIRIEIFILFSVSYSNSDFDSSRDELQTPEEKNNEARIF